MRRKEDPVDSESEESGGGLGVEGRVALRDPGRLLYVRGASVAVSGSGDGILDVPLRGGLVNTCN